MSIIRNMCRRKSINFTIAHPLSNQPAWYGQLRPREEYKFADGKEFVIEITDFGKQ